ncbi:hypothetical protein QJS10_CPA02g00277 [Acorus calamus]|uniref:Uncharacterized protein n=1 Tax=Acorus calamus TaxID=4465 RepID=A0AAV9FE46_ACOCL|nr:hypothetical protein QJS10_CPA02g00276 [Acorus calamus]KAK1323118.1 hypothetical protein QJS10_CPA02g00277 [Acorus calamus]
MVLHAPITQAFKLTALFWPLNMWFPMARQIPRVCRAVSATASLFAFHMRRISHDDYPLRRQRPARWERALRLLFDELVPGLRRRRLPAAEAEMDADSLQALLSISM